MPITGGTPIDALRGRTAAAAPPGCPTTPSSSLPTPRAVCRGCRRPAASRSRSPRSTLRRTRARIVGRRCFPTASTCCSRRTPCSRRSTPPSIEVVDVDTGERKVVYRGGTYARYVPYRSPGVRQRQHDVRGAVRPAASSSSPRARCRCSQVVAVDVSARVARSSTSPTTACSPTSKAPRRSPPIRSSGSIATEGRARCCLSRHLRQPAALTPTAAGWR